MQYGQVVVPEHIIQTQQVQQQTAVRHVVEQTNIKMQRDKHHVNQYQMVNTKTVMRLFKTAAVDTSVNLASERHVRPRVADYLQVQIQRQNLWQQVVI